MDVAWLCFSFYIFGLASAAFFYQCYKAFQGSSW